MLVSSAGADYGHKMGRPSGRKNDDHAETRAALVERAATWLLLPEHAAASFRDLAAACDVSPSTLRHYFDDRDAVLDAVFAFFARAGEPYLVAAVVNVPDDLETSLRAFLRELLVGWRFGVGGIHAFTLKAGLGDARFGPAYVDRILEPTLQAVEARLARHVAAGTLPPCDVRSAALSLVSPVLLALLHQDTLGGRGCRPLDVDAYADDHVARFLRAWGPPTSSTPPRVKLPPP